MKRSSERIRAGFGLVVLATTVFAALASCSSPGANETDASPSQSADVGTSPSDAGLFEDGSPGRDATLPADATLPTDATLPADAALPTDATVPFDAEDAAGPDTSAPQDAANGADASIAPSTSTTIDLTGGVLVHPLGAVVVVPPGALTSPTLLTLSAVAAPTAGAIGTAFVLAPQLAFATPITVTLDYAPSAVVQGGASLAIEESVDQGTSFASLSTTTNAAARTLSASALKSGEFVPIAAASGGALFVTTPSPLADATAGVAYTASFAATGGTSPYACSLSDGTSLPPGLVLASSGAVSGSPTAAGHYSFLVAVTDSTSNTTQAAFSMNVAPPNNPAPALTSLAPSDAPANNDVNVVVTGTGFLPSTTIQLGSTAVAKTWVSATQIVAQLVASNIATAGTYTMTATNPAPGGGTSNTITFTADTPNYPVPTLSALAPTTSVQNQPVTVTLTGSGFTQWTTVQVGGKPVTAQRQSTTQIVAQIPASILPTAGAYDVTAANPAPGGGTSNALAFTVTAYDPSAPVSATIGIAGGWLAHPLGAAIIVPPGALASPTALTLTPVLPPSNSVLPAAFQLSPAGVVFKMPVTVELFDVEAEEPDGAASSATSLAESTDNGASFVLVSSAGNGNSSQGSTLFAGHVLETAEFAWVTAPGSTNSMEGSASLSTTVGTSGSLAVMAVLPSGVTWSLAPGSALPPGLSLSSSGVMPGTPTTVGLYAFSLIATNGVVTARTNAALAVGPAGKPTPTLTSVAPSHAPSNALTGLVVTGTGFVPGSYLSLGTAGMAASWISPTELVASVTMSVGAGSFNITDPTGGGTSNAIPFTVNPAGVPVLASVVPAQGPAGRTTHLLLSGTALGGSTFNINGSPVSTTGTDIGLGSPTQYLVELPAATISAPGTYTVTMTTSGGTTNALQFVAQPTPIITAISPAFTPIGSPSTQVTITGSYFTSGSTVLVNGAVTGSSYVSPTELIALMPAADLSATGTLAVVVQNAAPYPYASLPAPFHVGANADGTPIVTGVSPGAIPAGADHTLVLAGSGFTFPTLPAGMRTSNGNFAPGTLCQQIPALGYVLFDGVAVETLSTGVTWTSATAFVPKALTQSPHTATVTYVNPPWGGTDGGVGNTVSVEVTAVDGGCSSCTSPNYCQDGICCGQPGQITIVPGQSSPVWGAGSVGACCSGAEQVTTTNGTCATTCLDFGQPLPTGIISYQTSAATFCCGQNFCQTTSGTYTCK